MPRQRLHYFRTKIALSTKTAFEVTFSGHFCDWNQSIDFHESSNYQPRNVNQSNNSSRCCGNSFRRLKGSVRETCRSRRAT